MTGKRIAVTGKGPMTRIEIAKIIQAKGDIFQDTVTHITDFLLTDDLNRSSHKINLARLYKVQILTYDQYFGLNQTSTPQISSTPSNQANINTPTQPSPSAVAGVPLVAKTSGTPQPQTIPVLPQKQQENDVIPPKPEQKILIYKMKQDFKEIYKGEWNYLESIFNQVGNIIQDYETAEDFNRRFAMNLIKELIIMFKNSQLNHRDFNVDAMKGSPNWMPLIKIIMVIRIDELKQCKIVQIGKKYDISDLRKSYIGNVIAENLFQRRYILTGADYAVLIQQIQKLNVAPPITIRPTTTEVFFAEKE
jgi:hypothetical protein